MTKTLKTLAKRRTIFAVVLALTIFGAVYGFAATLSVGANTLSAGNASVASCETSGTPDRHLHRRLRLHAPRLQGRDRQRDGHRRRLQRQGDLGHPDRRGNANLNTITGTIRGHLDRPHPGRHGLGRARHRRQRRDQRLSHAPNGLRTGGTSERAPSGRPSSCPWPAYAAHTVLMPRLPSIHQNDSPMLWAPDNPPPERKKGASHEQDIKTLAKRRTSSQSSSPSPSSAPSTASPPPSTSAPTH